MVAASLPTSTLHAFYSPSHAQPPPYRDEVEKLNKFQTEVIRKHGFFDFSAALLRTPCDPTLPKGWEPDENVSPNSMIS